MKKVLSMLLILCLFISFSAVPLSVGATTQNNDIVWDVTGGTLTVNTDGILAFASSAEAPWHEQRNNITSVIIGGDVDEIGGETFCGLLELKHVTISEGVHTLNWSAFSNVAKYIRFFEIPASMESIVSSYNFIWPIQVAYHGTEQQFKEVCGFDDIDYEGRSYERIKNVNTDFIYLPENDDIYGTSYQVEWSLDEESGIISFTGDGAMRDYITVDDFGWEEWASVAPWYSFRDSITKVVFSDNVSYIGNNAFAYCKNLTEVDFGNIVEIGYGSFHACSSLEAITLPATLEMLSSDSFSDSAFTYDFENETLSNNWSENFELYMTAEDGDVFLVAMIREVYDENDVLISQPEYTVRAGTKVIANGCFGGSFSENLLTKVNLGEVESIGASAFYGQTNLSDIDLSKVKKIGTHAFRNCSSLQEIDVSSANEIGRYAFTNTGYYNNNENWEYGLLYAGKWLLDSDLSQKKYIIKPGTTKMSIDYISMAEELAITENFMPITYDFLSSMQGLESIYIPKGADIEPLAFDDCWNLTDVYYAGSEDEWTYSFEDHYVNPIVHYNCSELLTQHEQKEDGTIDVRLVHFPAIDEQNNTAIAAGFAGTIYKTMDFDVGNGSVGMWDMTINGTDVDTIKVLLWDNLSNIKPICEGKEIQIEPAEEY